MLLYDCGGGTTDIALVRAKVEGDRRTLRITVLRRSGVRTFGGDDITHRCAVCSRPKSRMPWPSTEKGPPPHAADFPGKPPEKGQNGENWPARLENFIEDMAVLDPQDRSCSTRTLPGQDPTEDRLSAALALWRMGENLKLGLASEKPSEEAASGTFVAGLVRLPPLEVASTPDPGHLPHRHSAGLQAQKEAGSHYHHAHRDRCFDFRSRDAEHQ